MKRFHQAMYGGVSCYFPRMLKARAVFLTVMLACGGASQNVAKPETPPPRNAIGDLNVIGVERLSEALSAAAS